MSPARPVRVDRPSRMMKMSTPLPLAIGTDRLRDRDVAFPLQYDGECVLPGAAVGPAQLHLHDVLVALPRLVKHKTVLGAGILVQDRLMERPPLAHGIEDPSSSFKELIAAFRRHVEFYEIR